MTKRRKGPPAPPKAPNPLSLAPLVAACAAYWSTFAARQAHHVASIWTTEIQRLRAEAFRAAHAVMLACDARVADLGNHPVVAQLMMPLFAMLRDPYPLIYKTATADEVAFDVNWARHAYPTFTLTPDLASQLLLTDPSKVDEGDVPWPFDAFRVVLPPELGLAFVDQRGAPLRAQCFRVFCMRAPDPPASTGEEYAGAPLGDLYAAFAIDLYKAELTKVLDEHFRRIAGFPVSGRVFVRLYGATSLSVFHNSVWEGSGTFCGEWLDVDIGENPNPLFGAHFQIEGADERALIVTRRLALNLALYLRSKREDTGAPVWSPTAKAASPTNRTWALGGHVRVGAEVRDAAKAVVAGRPHGDVRVRHVVRGHFKHAGADKRAIYVAPYRMVRATRHRVELRAGTSWSLFLCGPSLDGWGFFTPSGYVDHDTYDHNKGLTVYKETT